MTGSRCASSSSARRSWVGRWQAGGHLTHGFRPNISGKLFRHRSLRCRSVNISVGLRRKLGGGAHEERPLILIAGYSSYPRLVNFRVLREIADEVGATFMVDMAHFAGLVAGKVHTGDYTPSPTRTSSRRQPTRPCAVPAVDLSFAARNSRSSSIAVSAGTRRSPSPTSWQPRRRVDRSVAAVLPGLCGSGCRQRAGLADALMARGCWRRDQAERTTISCSSMSVTSVSTDDKPSPRAARPGSR